MKLTAADRYANPMTEKQMVDFLERENVMMRLGMIDEDGYPIVHPVWFAYEEGSLWAVVERRSLKARALRKNTKVYFTIDKSADPPKGVRGRATAQLIEDDSLALKVTKKHLLKYHGRIDDDYARGFLDSPHEQVVIKVTPIFLATWDYTTTRHPSKAQQ